MSIEHELENRCPKCGHPWVKHGGDEVTALCPSPPVTSRVAARIIRTQRVAQASARTSARQLLADARGILDADGGQDAAELVKRIDALETEDRAVEAGLAFLLTRIGSWSYARWDQWLRHEFGDEAADRMIPALKKLSGLE